MPFRPPFWTAASTLAQSRQRLQYSKLGRWRHIAAGFVSEGVI
ncbi:unnamed protein product [Protopolystoma xenopodis]|uniref:Uncharacterized protein n=1 Tax=Protopolystoma xenopodis TaxID=117903 RepID=A0A3S5BMY5_9PLAT|nr:unnamed protein product [Protopolystoma xenopodis]